ncbi:hypothetical protein Dcar01_02385 [Deinococcus carri]|uniref:Uncharacterized protein n=1 Tax=Deinococcus carri TaxID=1211323 RepID=A0ABP9W933_9DEIO
MDEAARKRVAFLVQPAAWKYHQGLDPAEQADLDEALAQLGDLRLVAAYVLDVAAAAARTEAAQGNGEQVKRFRVEGQYEEEYFAPTSSLKVDADAWTTLADSLREEVEAEKRQATQQRPRGGTVVLPVESGF